MVRIVTWFQCDSGQRHVSLNSELMCVDKTSDKNHVLSTAAVKLHFPIVLACFHPDFELNGERVGLK